MPSYEKPIIFGQNWFMTEWAASRSDVWASVASCGTSFFKVVDSTTFVKESMAFVAVGNRYNEMNEKLKKSFHTWFEPGSGLQWSMDTARE
jgi:hypothetical protein